MSLYDDLDMKEGAGKSKMTKSSVVPGWSPGYKLLASSLKAKQASVLQPKRQRSSQLAPVVDLKRHGGDGELQFNMHTGKLEKVIMPQASIAVAPATPAPIMPMPTPFIATAPTESITGVADEYDPFKPNEYDDVVKTTYKKEKEREQERLRKREERKDRETDRDRDRDRDRDNNRRRDRSDDSDRRRDRDDSDMPSSMKRRDEEEEEMDRSRRTGGAAIAPPSMLLEEPPINPDERPKSPQIGGMAMMGSVAGKIMAKYGYRKGQGLGKTEQGMSTALYVEKTSKRGGKIIHERDMPSEQQAAQDQQTKTNTNLLKNPSKVIMLQNMVGPGEVDEDLEPETAEECTKYGKVNKCVIFEIPNVPDDEGVRIFVEFERIDSAIKGLIDLNGRFFGGRVVKACFYNLDKFRRMDYISPVE